MGWSLLGATMPSKISDELDWADAVYMQQMTQANAQAQAAQAMQLQQYGNPTPPPTSHQRARDLFIRRMGGVRNEFKVDTGDFLMCHVHRDEVFVFYLFGGKEGVVHESVDSFPSDQLITQFRLVLA